MTDRGENKRIEHLEKRVINLSNIIHTYDARINDITSRVCELVRDKNYKEERKRLNKKILCHAGMMLVYMFLFSALAFSQPNLNILNGIAGFICILLIGSNIHRGTLAHYGIE